MKVTILASGSKGNSTYIETPKTKILIDAGISYLQIKQRLNEEKIELCNIDAIFVSHEHADHVLYLASVLCRTNAKLYIDKISYDIINKKTNNSLLPFEVTFIKDDLKYQLEDIVVVPISLSHDSKAIHGFLMKELNTDVNKTFASITDTGIIPQKYFPILSSINTIFIESNHDVEMLMSSRRPWILIQRILSPKGHLSNQECMEYLTKFVSKHTKNIILAHLSEDCNLEKLAEAECYKYFTESLPFKLYIAKQYEELPLIEVE